MLELRVMGKIQKLFSYMILLSDGNGLARRVLLVSKNGRKQTPLTLKNMPPLFVTFFHLSQSERVTAFSSRLMMLAKCLDAGPPLAFVYIEHFCRVRTAGSKDPNHQCVCLYSTHFDWTSFTTLYLLALLSSLQCTMPQQY